jgi:hypothetical protein
MRGYIGQFQRPCHTAKNPYNERPQSPTVDSFTLIGVWPSLTIWQRVCTVCGKLFKVTTPSNVGADHAAFQITTCETHRQTSPG